VGEAGPAGGLPGWGHINPQILTSMLSRESASVDTPLVDPQTGEPLVSTITVPHQGELTQVRVSVDVTHGDLSELTVTLRSPAGTEVTLHAEAPGGDLQLTFPDDREPVVGSMDDFLGEEGAGDWQLILSDATIGTVATVNVWSVEVTHKSLDQLDILGLIDLHSGKLGRIDAANDPGDAVSRGEVDEAIAALRAELSTRPVTGTVYRWNVFDTYLENSGWYASNRADLFGGVNPSNWTDGRALASGISADKEVQRTLFIRKGYAGADGNLVSDSYEEDSSTNGRVAVVLFRVRNDAEGAIVWRPNFYYTCYDSWSERSSVAVNGQLVWDSGGANCAITSRAINLSIPPGRTSTVIFVSTTMQPWSGRRALLLSFFGGSLALPEGLSYVDDLDRAQGGWDQ